VAGKWTTDEQTWRALRDGDGCPVCVGGQPEGIVAELPHAWVTAGGAAAVRGYACVVARRHVVEPFELPEAERGPFFDDVLLVARVVDDLYRPIKMNSWPVRQRYRPLARDHAAPGGVLSRTRAFRPERSLRPCPAWCSRPRNSATLPDGPHEIHGNTIPHLHVHLYPRWPGDSHVGGPIDWRRRLFTPGAEELDRLRTALAAAAADRTPC
jgi:diadenosine tetraphosphate (Ap4A) HIT family hydrolase